MSAATPSPATASASPAASHGVYVANLSFYTTEESLAQYLADCGTITRLFLPLDSDRRNRGFAFVDFAEQDAVRRACDVAAVEGRLLDGFLPYIRRSEEEHAGDARGAVGGPGGEGKLARFGCQWDLVLLWDEPDPETVRPNPRLERELFVPSTAGINFDKYDAIEVQVDAGEGGAPPPPPLTSFAEAGLCDLLTENLVRCGYAKPTPIQKHAVPIGLARRDLMACAQTGSGKTAAFLVPVVQEIMTRGYRVAHKMLICPHTLVLVPTRELAAQIFQEAQRLSYLSFVRAGVITGGKDLARQLMDVDETCAILIATPGRLIDIMARGKLTLREVRVLILDEADRMLDMGFEPQIRQIVQQEDLPVATRRQTMMFSATFPKSIRRLALDFLNRPLFVSVGKVGSVSSNITQRVEYVDEATKDSDLMSIMDAYLRDEGEDSRHLMVVFVRMKRTAWRLERKLASRGYLVASIHGDKTQKEREDALESFKAGEIPFLIATDVAARGLDIPTVNFVVNYDLPDLIDDYVHRIGRTARAGRLGYALAFYTDENAPIARSLADLLEECGVEVPPWLLEAAKERFAAEENFKGWDRINFAPPPAGKERVYASVSKV